MWLIFLISRIHASLSIKFTRSTHTYADSVLFVCYVITIFFSSDHPTKVTGIRIEERKRNLTNITWNLLTFRICTPEYQFRLLFKNQSAPLFENTTSKNFFVCDLRCAKATELEILAIVDGMKWNITKFNLSEIEEGEFL